MSSSEFKTTNPLKHEEAATDLNGDEKGVKGLDQSSQLLRFSLRFDPYSPTADEDYDQLKSELRRFDIVGLLKEELAKSRVHTALARKILDAIRYLDEKEKNEAVLSILANSDLLLPIFSSVLLMLDKVFDELTDDTKSNVMSELRVLIQSPSHVMRVDVYLAFAVRVLAHENTADNLALLQQLYEQRTSPLIRRDIILILARWGEWYWLSDLRNRFRELSGPERRAFIAASYMLKDEGDHWRKHIVKELDFFEKFILSWAGEKANAPAWTVPL